MATPVLWHFPISHYNEKVRWALDWKHIPHVRRTLGPDYLPRVWWATRRGTLPVLWLDDSGTIQYEPLGAGFAPDMPMENKGTFIQVVALR